MMLCHDTQLLSHDNSRIGRCRPLHSTRKLVQQEEAKMTGRPLAMNQRRKKAPVRPTSTVKASSKRRQPSPDLAGEVSRVAQMVLHLPADLVFAITRPIGTQTDEVVEHLTDRLRIANFDIHQIQLRDMIVKAYQRLYGNSPKNLTRRDLMSMGDYLRFTFGNSILARLAISEMYEIRGRREALQKARAGRGIAFLVTNLMHPAEVAELRSVYKQRFFMIGVHQNFDSRLERLMLEQEGTGLDEEHAKTECQTLMSIDQGLVNTNAETAAGALSVDDTFHQADLFVNSENKDECEHAIYRLVDQIFTNPFGTPDTDERHMAFAYLASQCSAAFGRPVGAALVGDKGGLLSIGWNDPPAFGGGLYNNKSEPDYRDASMGRDVSDVHKVDAVHQFLVNILNSDDWMRDISAVKDTDASNWLEQLASVTENLPIVPKSVAKALPALRSVASSRILNLIEFGRPVHAEMAALMAALRKGLSSVGATLYVTTFPCHECIRHIIAAGLERVVYVEPYGKSMAADIHGPEVELAANKDAASRSQRKLLLEPYEGISPKRFADLFSWVERKVKARDVAKNNGAEVGSRVDWNRSNRELRPSILGYTSLDGLTTQAAYFDLSRYAAEIGVHRVVTALLDEQRDAAKPVKGGRSAAKPRPKDVKNGEAVVNKVTV
jgi:deoxycytidylate deaminase